MPRIPYHDQQGLSESLQAMISARKPLNLYRMLPHAPTLMPGFLQMGLAIRTETEIDAKLREMVILRTGAILGARYELYQHRRVAQQAGVDDKDIDAACNPGTESVCDEDVKLVLEFTDALVTHTRAGDALFHRTVERFGYRGTCEMLLTCGFYMMVSCFLENTGVEIEDKPAF